MTDVAIPDDKPGEVAPAAPQPDHIQAHGNALVQWAFEARQAAGIATSLAKTNFVPASLRNKPDDITAAILAGQELGLKPMATLRSMDVIQGTPALRAHAMRGLVQSHGHEVELVESTPELCRMRGRRKGSETWQEVVWTIGRARDLGLLSKDQWKKQPQTMLIARATGEICRLIASDVLYAMPYAAEELDHAPYQVVRATERTTVEEIARQHQARRAPEAQAAIAPPAPAAEPSVPESNEPVDIWTQIEEARQIRGWDESQAEAEFERWAGGEQMGGAGDQQLRDFVDYMVEGAAA